MQYQIRQNLLDTMNMHIVGKPPLLSEQLDGAPTPPPGCKDALMLRVRLRAATMVVTLGILAGHAAAAPNGKDDDCTATHSFAWCVLSLFGSVQGLQDDTRRSGDATTKVMNGVGVGLGAGQIVGKVSAPPGVNAGAFGALTILSAMAGPPGGRLRAMAFVPIVSGAAESDDETIRTELIRAIGSAAVQTLKGETFEVESEEKNPPLGRKAIDQHIRVTGGDCSAVLCEVRSWWFRSNLPVKRVALPRWMGGGSVAGWSAGGGKYIPTLTVDGHNRPMSDLVTLMENLPGHFFLYVPAGDLEPVPVMLHGAERLRFIGPQRAAIPGIEATAPSAASSTTEE
jgi:hypothetical protein